ncbi:hypothetical protein M378DRAFT_181709 [Amanita muscaria Koide BX008]|uniref:Uncharacterized protein n=1 Tax=Amanita muscaria (strain Koide BX008) TaxID=946122 RepID=A0A0C2S3I1_AMAMK|nr:hypothetical protein M378DRAFT_181709 [Amanita muscaria Koide BX008]
MSVPPCPSTKPQLESSKYVTQCVLLPLIWNNDVNKLISQSSFLTDPKRMSSAKLMTTSITLHSVPDGTIAGGAAEGNDSICIGRESKGYSQSDECEDSFEMHGELDW